MTPKILGNDYDKRIRNRLGVGEAHLSISEIDEVLPEIEARVIERVPDYAFKTDNNKVYLDSAVVCLTASALCSVLRKKYPVKEQGPSGSFETPIDWEKEAVFLNEQGSSYLSKINPVIKFSIFKVG